MRTPFVPFRPGQEVGLEGELTGGYKALIGISFIMLFIAMAAAVTTLVLVAIRFDENCCNKLKHKLHDLPICQGCIPPGESGCSSNSDCCQGFNMTVQCKSGTCQQSHGG